MDRYTRRRPDLPSFRIPEHKHTHPRDGGALDAGLFGGGSGGSGGPGGGTGVPLTVTDGSTSVTPADTITVTGATVADLGGNNAGITIAAPTGFELNTQGGQDVIKAHGSMGATETFDPADGNVHTGTLNANCTVTLTAPTGTGACTLELWLTEDGTGGWAVTWPGSVTEQGTHTTTASTTSRVILETVDGGTTWVATWIGGASGTVTSVGLSMPAEFTVTGSPVTGSGTLAVAKANEGANLVYAGPASGAAAAPTFRALVAADIPAGVGGSGSDHGHVMDCLFSGDGSTTVWTLPASPFDQYSVQAFVAGVLTEVTLSGADWAVATFGSAPGSGTNNIRFDIVAAVA